MLKNETFKGFCLNIKDKIKNLRTNQTFMVCSLLTIIYLISGYCKWIEIAMCICALVFMVLLPLQNSFCIFTFLHCFTLSNIGYDSCFIVTLIGYCIILLVKYIIGVRKGKYIFHKKLVRVLAIVIGISLIISASHKFYRGAWLYLTYVPFFYLIYAMREEFNIAQAMNYMLGGMFATGILSIISLTFPYFQYSPIFEGRFRGFINNTNYLYIRALFLLSYYMYRYLSKELSHAKFITIFLGCSVLTLATLSKTGIGMLALITLIFVVLYLKQDFKKNIKVVGVFLIIVAAISLICFKLIAAILERFADSFKAGDFWNSLLTGRDDIWRAYLTAIFENPFKFLFGHGLLAEEVYIPEQLEPRASHNLYIFLLYRFGVVGCCVLAYILYKTFKSSVFSKPSLISHLPLIFIMIESLFDNTFKCYHFTYFAFAVMILFIESKNATKNPIEEHKNKKINK